MRAIDRYEAWRTNEYFDEAFRAELDSIASDTEEIEERFYQDLVFGTAGMRGIIGAGTNRINEYIVRKATQGFANFLLKRQAKLNGTYQSAVAIAYDSRRKSYEFALETALVMAGNGIKAYLFDGVRTTPELSFAVRHLNCIGGVMVTASHNPPQYNGYKVYDETGCQLVPELADALVEEVNAVVNFESVLRMDKKEAVQNDLLKIIDEDVDLPYVEMVKTVSIRPELLMHSDLKVVYTPLHGTGGATVSRTLKELSFSGLIPVEAQMAPDGEFPTCSKPNPEEYEAFALAIEYAERYDADLAIATDPDCDRIGLLIKDQNHYRVLTGNQIGSLFIDYVLSSKAHWSDQAYIVNTIVSSNLAVAQAKAYGVRCIQTLTGFKFIGEQIEKDRDHFIMGYEESYGYLFSPEVRDKDAVMGTLLAIEMTEYYRRQGKTLLMQLDEIYQKHGYFLEETISKQFEGREGHQEMEAIMIKFRTAGQEMVPVKSMIDYQADGTGLPKSNVLKFYLDDHSWFVLRPSGTEPKLKVYFSIADTSAQAAKEKLEYYKAMILEKIRA
jgi:phosphoglucomutase